VIDLNGYRLMRQLRSAAAAPKVPRRCEPDFASLVVVLTVEDRQSERQSDGGSEKRCTRRHPRYPLGRRALSLERPNCR
jgi:hypothetical protein